MGTGRDLSGGMCPKPPRPAVLLGCEAGLGRGHVVTLATVARALSGRATVHARIPKLDHAAILAPWCASLSRGMHLRRSRRPGTDADDRRGATWAHWLVQCGFDKPELLRNHVSWWRDTMLHLRPALVIAEWAPCALLAARSLGLPCVATGASFGLPPATLARFPSLDPDIDGAPVDEEALCARINATLVPEGLEPLDRLAQVYASDLALPRGIVHWDPYRRWRREPLLLPLDRLPPLSEGRGREVFIYFSSIEFSDPALVETLCTLPFPAILVAPSLPDILRARLQANPLLSIAPAPLRPAEIVARARVVLCAGQAGTMALAVLAGLPVLALPMHSEQKNNAMGAAAALSSCRWIAPKERSAAAVIAELRAMLADAALPERARAAAPALRATFPDDAVQVYRRQLSQLLAARLQPPFPGLTGTLQPRHAEDPDHSLP